MRLAAGMQSLLALADQTPLEVAARLQRRAGDRRVSQVKMAPGADRREGERRKAMGCVVNANADGIGKVELSADLERLYARRSEEHTSELQSLMRISYAVFCLKKKKIKRTK